MYKDRDEFDKAIRRFKLIIEHYQAALRQALGKSKAAFEKRIVDEFMPRWTSNPPRSFAQWGVEATPKIVKAELEHQAQKIFDSAIAFDDPKVKVLYKNVAPQNIRDDLFTKGLKKIMEKRHVPKVIIDFLFETGEAAPESGAFKGQ